jgi:hypothetical protein
MRGIVIPRGKDNIFFLKKKRSKFKPQSGWPTMASHCGGPGVVAPPLEGLGGTTEVFWGWPATHQFISIFFCFFKKKIIIII